MTQTFENFLKTLLPPIEKKFEQVNKATWILETTSSQDAADLKAALDTELRILLSDPNVYKTLLSFEKEAYQFDPVLKRQLNVLLRIFKQNQIPKELLEEISKKEASLALAYGQFRACLDGKKISENEIRNVLKNEVSVPKRIMAWEASKQIGNSLAPLILEVVKLRNKVANILGYEDYFKMQLDLQEVDEKFLINALEELSVKSEKAYLQVLAEIEAYQSSRFSCSKQDLGPWAWSEPFCQEDPIDSQELDSLVTNVDIVQSGTKFYDFMGIDVRPIFDRSDMYEREGKNQHAFCIHIDRKGDVRTLNNVKPTMKWLETVLHEYGHAIYDAAIDSSLPWLLREPPHMITTEAMALLAGRQAYLSQTLLLLLGSDLSVSKLVEKSEKSLTRRQLIFSRFVLVMTAFERQLYQHPDQDLNELWWSCVEKYQKIARPKNRENANDWASKYHIGLAPVYYFSYLLGEVFASSLQKMIRQQCHCNHIATQDAGRFLEEKLFKKGNLLNWHDLIRYATAKDLCIQDWIDEFC